MRHLLVRQAKHAITSGMQIRIPALVVGQPRAVTLTVDLKHKPFFCAKKIDDERTDGHLASEFPALKTARSQHRPDFSFWWRHLKAKTTGTGEWCFHATPYGRSYEDFPLTCPLPRAGGEGLSYKQFLNEPLFPSKGERLGEGVSVPLPEQRVAEAPREKGAGAVLIVAIVAAPAPERGEKDRGQRHLLDLAAAAHGGHARGVAPPLHQP